MNYKKTYQSLPISTSAIIRLKGLWFSSSKGNFQTFELHHSTVSIFFTSGKPLASHFVCGHCSKLASTITPLYMSFSLSSLMLSLNHSTWAVCLILVLISNLVQVDLCQWNINIFNSATSRFALSFSQCHCLQIIHRSRLHYLPFTLAHTNHLFLLLTLVSTYSTYTLFFTFFGALLLWMVDPSYSHYFPCIFTVTHASLSFTHVLLFWLSFLFSSEHTSISPVSRRAGHWGNPTPTQQSYRSIIICKTSATLITDGNIN